MNICKFVYRIKDTVAMLRMIGTLSKHTLELRCSVIKTKVLDNVVSSESIGVVLIIVKVGRVETTISKWVLF